MDEHGRYLFLCGPGDDDVDDPDVAPAETDTVTPTRPRLIGQTPNLWVTDYLGSPQRHTGFQ